MRIEPDDSRQSLSSVIAFVAGQLICGKEIVSLYDYATTLHIEAAGLTACSVREQPSWPKWSVPVPGQSTRHQYRLDSGDMLDIAINGATFIATIIRSGRHFVGTVRGNTICILDEQTSSHHNYRICGPEDSRNGHVPGGPLCMPPGEGTSWHE